MAESPLHPALQKLSGLLDAIAKRIIDGWNDDRPVSANWGWNHPVMTRNDLAKYSSELAKEIREKGSETLEPDILKIVEWWQANLANFETTIQYFYNGHGA